MRIVLEGLYFGWNLLLGYAYQMLTFQQHMGMVGSTELIHLAQRVFIILQ